MGQRRGPNALVFECWSDDTGNRKTVKASKADFLAGSWGCLRGLTSLHLVA